MCVPADTPWAEPPRIFNRLPFGRRLAILACVTLALEPTQVSPTAGWDAAPGRLIERGLSEGQPLSLPRFRFLHLIFGVGLPLASIAAEIATGWSAALYANPFPNGWLLLLAVGAPLSNLMLWIRLCTPDPPRWLGRSNQVLRGANALAVAVSFGYGLLYLPVAPASLILSVFAIGLLPLAPFFSLYTAWRLGQALRAVTGSQTLIPFLVGAVAFSTVKKVPCQTTE